MVLEYRPNGLSAQIVCLIIRGIFVHSLVLSHTLVAFPESHIFIITLTPYGRHGGSPATRLFVQRRVKANNKENTKDAYYLTLSVTGGFSPQTTSYREIVCLHVVLSSTQDDSSSSVYTDGCACTFVFLVVIHSKKFIKGNIYKFWQITEHRNKS